jgi:ATP-dependent Clp protease ATP-binding subunit ClpC
MKEIKSADDVVLFIDELHTIIGAGAAEGAIDAANMLKPALARGELQCVGATTLNEYKMYIEKDSALERRFQHVLVEEPSVEETLDILKGIHSRYEVFHKVKYTPESLEAAVVLSDRYIHERFLPDKAIDIIDEAGSKARFDNCDKPDDILALESEIAQLNEKKNDLVKMQEYEQAAALRDIINVKKGMLAAKVNDWQQKVNDYEIVVDADYIALIVSQWTGIPVEKIEESESQKLLRMEEELHRRVIGQDEAIDCVSRAIRRSRTGLKSLNRPIGSFIFLGPTGVGKTELAKALAEFLFDDEATLIRLDMSEYMEKHSVSKFIGSPPGYIGYDEGGQLTEKVKRKPFSVILFDEIEKAHPDIFNVLLQILEEGELTDNTGNAVSFRDTVIIMTSNVGNREYQHRGRLGFMEGADQSHAERDKVLEELRRVFSPELINRLDEIIYFHRLEKKHIRLIVDLLLEQVNDKLEERGIRLQFSPGVKRYLTDHGFDDKYGARHLRRIIQNEIEDSLATEMLKGRFNDAHVIHVGIRSKKISFKAIENGESAESRPVGRREKVDVT